MQVTRSIVLESGSRVRSFHADEHAELWKRVKLLPQEEQDLVEMSLKLGATHRQIGRMVGRSPGAVSRRLRRIGRRLHDPLVTVLLDHSCPLDAQLRQIGVEHLLGGLSTQEIATRHGLSRTRVLQILQMVRFWWREVRGMRVRG